MRGFVRVKEFSRSLRGLNLNFFLSLFKCKRTFRLLEIYSLEKVNTNILLTQRVTAISSPSPQTP